MEDLKKLKKMPFDKQSKKIEQYSVETLEQIAIKFYEEGYSHYRLGEDDIILHSILHERISILNNEFEWTNENKEKILRINEMITQTFQKAHNEALYSAKELKNKILKNDDFIKDFDIEIELSFYMNDEYYDENRGSIGYVLSEPVSIYNPIKYTIGGPDTLQFAMSDKPIFLNETLNWNKDFGDIFSNNYIGYGLYSLMETLHWSFKDILNINRICADVKVIHQYNIEII